MYRISLYRDYFERRRQARAKASRTGLIAGLVGVGVLLVGILAVSTVLLREKADLIRSETKRLNDRLHVSTVPRPEIDLARQLLDLRANRVDWSPKLSCLSDRLDRSLLLLDLTGQVSQKEQPSRLIVTGLVRPGVDQMAVVARFMESLREDPRIKGDLPEVKLGGLEGTASGKFQVTCESRRSGAPAGDGS
jgi:hypothetical protein